MVLDGKEVSSRTTVPLVPLPWYKWVDIWVGAVSVRILIVIRLLPSLHSVIDNEKVVVTLVWVNDSAVTVKRGERVVLSGLPKTTPVYWSRYNPSGRAGWIE